jgi:hypothetical protein
MFSKIAGVTAAIAVGASVTVAGAQNAAVQWKVSEGGNGHWYMLDSSRRPWTGAADRASALGGHLVTVNSYAEHVFLRSSVFTYCCSMSDTWMGATRSSTDEEYHWVTGEQFAPLPEIYFNNSAGWDAPALYLEQVIRFNWVGEWGGESNSANEGNFSVVEWSADCNNDGIVDYGQCHNGTLPDYKGNNIPDCCERGEACVVGSYPVQWRVEDGGNGHWYDQRIWTGPKAIIDISASYVAQVGAHAVTITSPSENEFVYRAVHSRTSGATHDGYSILGGYQDPGASDYSEPSGGWRWVTGEPMAYMNWGPGLPDNCCSGESVLQYPNASYWNDAETAGVPAGHQYRVIVEWSADCNNDGTVDYGQILTGQLTDANGNGVPDTCEFSDCNHDGIADAEQVKRGQLPDYDGNNVPDCCDRGEACVVGSYPVQWRTAEGGNGHWYQVSAPESRTWQSWNDWAIDFGGHLATVTSAAERDFIQPHVRTRIPLNKGAVLGARQDRNDPTWSEPGGGWKWITGEPWSWTNWTTWVANPSNSSYGECSCEDHLSLGRWAVTEDGAGNWNDYNGNLAMEVGAILEWSADCNNDGAVDYGQILRGEIPDINHNGTPDTCECIGDIYVDHAINGADLGALLAYWGPVTSSAASRACDLNGDGLVNGSDLGILLAYWGTCGN